MLTCAHSLRYVNAKNRSVRAQAQDGIDGSELLPYGDTAKSRTGGWSRSRADTILYRIPPLFFTGAEFIAGRGALEIRRNVCSLSVRRASKQIFRGALPDGNATAEVRRGESGAREDAAKVRSGTAVHIDAEAARHGCGHEDIVSQDQDRSGLCIRSELVTGDRISSRGFLASRESVFIEMEKLKICRDMTQNSYHQARRSHKTIVNIF